MSEGSCVGLDVHARSVVAGVIDLGSGEVRSLRVPPGSEATVAWLKTLPAPVGSCTRRGQPGTGLRGVCRGGDQLRCGGAVEDPAGGRSGQDGPA